jgi:hypothetical protein
VITRVITKKIWLNEENDRIKPEGFLPVFNDGRGRWETSILDGKNISEEDLWGKAEQLFKSFYGRADMKQQFIESIDLKVDIDKTPIEEHGNILGWSEEPSNQLLYATRLAKESMTIKRRFKKAE